MLSNWRYAERSQELCARQTARRHIAPINPPAGRTLTRSPRFGLGSDPNGFASAAAHAMLTALRETIRE